MALTIGPTVAAAGLTVFLVAPGTASAAGATPTQTTLASSANPSSGGAVTFTATVTSQGASVGASGSVTFTDLTSGATLCNAVSADSSGTASCATAGVFSGDADDVVADYSGTSDYLASSASITQLVQSGIPTQLGLASSDPDIAACTFGLCDSTYDVTYTATVTAASGEAGGTVTFTDDGAAAACSSGSDVVAVSAGVATCAVEYDDPASLDDAVVATLTPAAGELASSAEIYEVIGSGQAESSTLALTTSADPLATGTSVTYTATVTGEFNGTPSGDVTFTDGGAAADCASGSDVVALASGVATCTVSAGYPSTGTHTIEALYTGSAASGGYDNSNETFDEVVAGSVATPTGTSITSTADPSGVGEVAYDVAVTASSGTPTGSVTVSDGTNSCLAGLTGGSGSCSLDETAVASLTITASYPATAGFAGSAASITELTNSTALVSQTITFTTTPPDHAVVGGPGYDVAATGGASGNPVIFSSATPSVCTVSGSSVSFVGAGTCTIDADQAGNAQYAAAPTATQSFSVEHGAPCHRWVHDDRHQLDRRFVRPCRDDHLRG